MSTLKFGHLDPDARKEALLNACDDVLPNHTYTKRLSPEEMEYERQQLTDEVIAVDELKDDIKRYTDQVKAEIKPIENSLKERKTVVKTGVKEVTTEAYQFNNHDNGTVEVYDEMGEMITSRRMRPEERQTTIHSLHRAAL